jgi:hypothetical protein
MVQPATFYKAQRLIDQALVDSGRLQRGAVPSDAVYEDCLTRLSDLLALYQVRSGVKLWLNEILPVILTAGQAAYALGPAGSLIGTRPLRVPEAWYVLTGGARRPLEPLSWNTYNGMGNLLVTGEVTGYFVDKQRTDLIVKFWNTPSTSAATSGVVELLLQKFYDGPVTITQDVLFPVEWFIALRWGLADELATGQPPLIMQRCAMKAAETYEQLANWDVEDAPITFTQRAHGGAGFSSRFRK